MPEQVNGQPGQQPRQSRQPGPDGAAPPDQDQKPDRKPGQKPDRKEQPQEGERPQQSAPAAPEDEVLGAWEASEQLLSLAGHAFAAHSGNLVRDAEVGGDMVGGDKYAGVHLHSHASPALTRARMSGPLPADELTAVIEGFVPSRSYDQAHDLLRMRHVLVLHGRGGSGRRMAAVRLLQQVTGPQAKIIALDPGTEPAELAQHVESHCGHLLADPVTSRDKPLRAARLHALREAVSRRQGFLVVTVDPESALEGVDTFRWEPPGPAEVVRSRLRALLGPGQDAAGQAELLDRPETVRFLRSGPTPREADDFARLLVRHAHGRVSAAQLAGYGRAAASHLVDGWFDGTELTLREKAFLVALAVFQDTPYPVVMEAADALYREFRALETPGREPSLRVFASSCESLLHTARATEYDGTVESPWGVLPQRLVAFRDAGLWGVLLGRIWMTHPTVREPMLRWLVALGGDPRPLARIRAAVCAGTLAAHDFGFVASRLIAPWAASDLLRERQLAAWALVVAHGAGQEAVVLRLLRDWSRNGGEGRRWTVVRAYAQLGPEMLPTALADLAAAAREGETASANRLRLAVTQTLETLISGLAGAFVLPHLDGWYEAGGHLRRLAAVAFLRSGAHSSRVTVNGRERLLPPVVRWAREERTGWERYVAFWRAVLNEPRLRRDGLDRLAAWVRAAEHDEEYVTALERLLSAMAVTGNETDRLDHMLRKARRTAEQQPAVVERLRAALVTAETDG